MKNKPKAEPSRTMVYNKNEELLTNYKDFMDLDNYMKVLKNKTPKPCIKKFDKDTIKVKLDYKECENLSERDIILSHLRCFFFNRNCVLTFY